MLIGDGMATVIGVIVRLLPNLIDVKRSSFEKFRDFVIQPCSSSILLLPKAPPDAEL